MEEQSDAAGDPEELERAVRGWLAGYAPESPVVVVPVFNAYGDVIECVESLLASLPVSVPLLIIDDASPDRRIGDTLAPLAAKRGFHYARKPANGGFVATMNEAFAWAAPRDVVLVNSDVIVPSGWLERLRAAAYTRASVATATPLTNHGSILSVPYRDTPVSTLPRGLTVHELDGRIRESSQRRYPTIPTAIGHCTYFRRAALNIVGGFDLAFSPGYGEEVDFSQRAVMAGFCHVAADDLFVYHKGSRSFAEERSAARFTQLRKMQERRERKIATRYPWYHPWVQMTTRDTYGPLALALDSARAAALGMRVAIDATCVDDILTGTQVATLELIHALCATKPAEAHVSIIVRDHVDRRKLLGLDEIVDAVVPLSAVQHQPHATFDLLHRPFQIHTAADLELIKRIGRRCVVTQLDFISFANPSYFPTTNDWLRYKLLTRRVATSVDGVAYISADAERDARQQGVAVPDERGCVTYLGIDHQVTGREPAAGPAARVGGAAPFLLVLGTDFRHKNRTYAIRLLEALIARHGWTGDLVFAGPSVATGGSGTEEALARLEHPALADRIRYREHVDEAEKWALLHGAAAVLYPSICEGFGIVPFEAAFAGTPTLAARSSAVNELLGDDVAYLELLDVEADAGRVWSLLSDPACAARQIAGIKARSGALTWRAVGETTWGFYARILRLPPRPLASASAEPVEKPNPSMERQYRTLQEEYLALQKWALGMEAALTQADRGRSLAGLRQTAARVVRRVAARGG